MKDSKNDSTSALARFGRDKRARTVTSTAERVERRPRLQRDAADPEQPREHKRSSFNPNFTRENRPAFGEKPRRPYGDRPAYGTHPKRAYEDRPAYGEKPYGDKSYAPHRNEQRYDRKASQPYGKPARTPRPYGNKPAYGPYNGGTDEERDFNRERKFEKRFDRRAPKKQGGKFGKAPRTDFKKREDRPVAYPKYNPEKQTGAIRLNRFIAQSGICSRREADDFIVAGVVTVNGKVVTELGTKVMPTDEVRFNDARVQGEKKVYLVLNKPKGYVTSLEDPHATKTVMDLVKGACTERIYPVGRLDKNSLGLLLFTNDGDMTKQLTHPAYQKKKIYQVTLDKPLTRADMDRIAEGVTLEDGEIHADEIAYVKEKKQEIGIEIHSGRNRIVRRIFEFLGYEVKKLDRVYYAGLTKKNLKRGAWRFLTDEEVQRLKSGRYE